MSFAEKLSDGNQRVSSLSKYIFPKTDSFMTAANFERAFQRILLVEGDLRMNISGYRHLVVAWAKHLLPPYKYQCKCQYAHQAGHSLDTFTNIYACGGRPARG